jgi:two-component system phosphate regulon sensor histidine kinase PhoR
MMGMLSFKRKILILDLVLFTIFVAALYPFFEIGMVLFIAGFLFLFVTTTLFIVHRMTLPIQQITRAIVHYAEGKEEFLRPIILSYEDEEFDKIAYTLNSLSERIQKDFDLLKLQRKETEGILESLGEGVIALNPAGKITFANRVASKMLGAPHENIVGRSVLEIPSRHTHLLEKGRDLLLQVSQTSEPIVETVKTSNRLYLDLIAAPLAHQNGAILVLQDKTSDHKVLEMGRDFIANASHELRTPITIIRGFAETLQDHPNLPPELLTEITGKIVRTCGRLEKLVKSLLTLSDIENVSKDGFQPIDLKDLVEHCKGTLLTVHPETKVEVFSQHPKNIVFADASLLEMAIANLLDNAVKYSQGPADIEIRLRALESKLELHIQDRGIGIPDTDVPHIFDRFYTVDKARSRKSGGAGLGLSIVKNIIEKHNGSIGVLSKLGQGSIFIIRLPLTLV